MREKWGPNEDVGVCIFPATGSADGVVIKEGVDEGILTESFFLLPSVADSARREKSNFDDFLLTVSSLIGTNGGLICVVGGETWDEDDEGEINGEISGDLEQLDAFAAMEAYVWWAAAARRNG